MKEISEQEAYLRLAAQCAQAEHCSWEMTDKMRRWSLPEDARERVLARLQQERYVDDSRYARAYVKDKVRYQHWGSRKIQQGLWQKGISADIQQEALSEISSEQYLEVLRPLLAHKRKELRRLSGYELNQKLMRFALGRGFTFDLIRQCLDLTDDPIADDDAEYQFL